MNRIKTNTVETFLLSKSFVCMLYLGFSRRYWCTWIKWPWRS